MVAAHPLENQVTPEAYLQMERASDTKHEYIEGGVYAMSGGTPNHNIIAAQVLIALGGQFAGRKRCTFYTSDQCIQISASRVFTYPDLAIVCEQPRYEKTSLLNPTVIFEVLSPSTEAYDKGKKFETYQTLPSLQHYVLIAQDRARIEVYTRLTNGSDQNAEWRLIIAAGHNAVIGLDAIGCTLALADVYEGIVFDDPAALAPSESP